MTANPPCLRSKISCFQGTSIDDNAMAIAFTLIETAKLNGLDPQAWLTVVLSRIADHKITRPDSQALQGRGSRKFATPSVKIFKTHLYEAKILNQRQMEIFSTVSAQSGHNNASPQWGYQGTLESFSRIRFSRASRAAANSLRLTITRSESLSAIALASSISSSIHARRR